MDKRIEIIELPVSELKTEFGNPRKPLKKKAKEKLKESLDNLGDFGVIVIDEHNNIISGHQRVSILMENPDTQVLCKRLIGYSESELKAINIKANTHAGEWDMDKLAEWTADLKIDLSLDLENLNVKETKIKDMDLKWRKMCLSPTNGLKSPTRIGGNCKKMILFQRKAARLVSMLPAWDVMTVCCV